MKTHKNLPKNLYQTGFISKPSFNEATVNFSSIKLVRQWIRKQWMPNKRLNRKYNSYKISLLASKQLNTTINNGELIAAAIMEGYKYEESVVTALFYFDYKLNY